MRRQVRARVGLGERAPQRVLVQLGAAPQLQRGPARHQRDRALRLAGARQHHHAYQFL